MKLEGYLWGKTRLVICSDLHYTSRFTIGKSGERVSRLDTNIKKIVNDSKKADALIIAGDIFQVPNPTSEDRKQLASLLSSVGKPVYIIAGNHDFDAGICALDDIPYYNPSRFNIYNEIKEVIVCGFNVLFIPWGLPSEQAANLRKFPDSKFDFLVGHCEVRGGLAQPEFVWKEGLSLDELIRVVKPGGAVFYGHFHPQKVINYKDRIVIQPGAPIRLGFQHEKLEPGYIVVEKYRVYPQTLLDAEFHTVRSIKDVDDLIDKDKVSGNFFRIQSNPKLSVDIENKLIEYKASDIQLDWQQGKQDDVLVVLDNCNLNVKDEFSKYLKKKYPEIGKRLVFLSRRYL